MSPLLTHALAWARATMPAVETLPPATLEARRADAAAIARAFRTPEGEAALEVIAKATLLRPPTNPDLHGSASHDFCQRRTGENGVFLTLVHLLDAHDHLERTDHDRRSDRRPEPEPVFGWRDAPGLAAFALRPTDPGPEDGGAAGGFDPYGQIGLR